MKDPLQAEQSPYEVLGVGRGASDAEVNKAFALGMARRVNPQQLAAARTALLRPDARALVDVLQYNDDWLRELEPNPLDDPECLSGERRLRTAEAWERDLKNSFPDDEVAHCLAVLWYWWVRAEEDRLSRLATAAPRAKLDKPRDPVKTLLASAIASSGVKCQRPPGCEAVDCRWHTDCTAPAPALASMWEASIAYWSMLFSTEEVWRRVAGRDGLKARELVSEQLRGSLRDAGERCASNGFAPLAPVYRDLDTLLAAETRTADQIAGAAIRTKSGRVRCGALMLRRLGLLTQVEAQLAGLLMKKPGDERLTMIQRAISPFAPIGVLVDSSRFDEALGALDALPVAQRSLPAVVSLRDAAMRGKARQLASVGQEMSALDAWEEILRSAVDSPSARAARDEVFTLANDRCAKWGAPRRDDTIALLERAMNLLRRPVRGAGGKGWREVEPGAYVRGEADRAAELQPHLAELLCQKGIDLVVDVQKRVTAEGSRGAADRQAVAEGVKCLERAKSLGSKRAVEQLKAGQAFLEELSGGIHDLTGKALALVKRASDQSARDTEETLTDAVNLLRQAAHMCERQAQAAVLKRLANCLTNRGVKKVNRAMAGFNARVELAGSKLSAFADALDCPNYGPRCSAPGCYSMAASGFNGPRGQFQLCILHSVELKMMMAVKPTPTTSEVSLIQAGCADVEEATRLDPGSDHAKTNLASARELMTNMKITPNAGARPKEDRDWSPKHKAKPAEPKPAAAKRAAAQPAAAKPAPAKPAAARPAATRPVAGAYPAWLANLIGLAVLFGAGYLLFVAARWLVQ